VASHIKSVELTPQTADHIDVWIRLQSIRILGQKFLLDDTFTSTYIHAMTCIHTEKVDFV
jgi:hypothetical protein